MRLGFSGLQVDPWMLSKIRLADRRGLLVGSRASTVQSDAIEMLLIDEAWRAEVRNTELAQQHFEQLKAILLDKDAERIRSVFSEWFDDGGSAVAVADADLDSPAADEWSAPEVTPSLSTIEDLLAKIGTTGVVSSTQDGWQ